MSHPSLASLVNCRVCGVGRTPRADEVCINCLQMYYILTPIGPWVADGLCAQADPEAWFALGVVQAQAKRLCQGCPVIEECLEYALTANEPWGVWGGTTARERKGMRRASA